MDEEAVVALEVVNLPPPRPPRPQLRNARAPLAEQKQDASLVAPRPETKKLAGSYQSF